MIIAKFTENSGGKVTLALGAEVKSTVKENVINDFFNADGIRAILVHGAKCIVNHGFALIGLIFVFKHSNLLNCHDKVLITDRPRIFDGFSSVILFFIISQQE